MVFKDAGKSGGDMEALEEALAVLSCAFLGTVGICCRDDCHAMKTLKQPYEKVPLVGN